MFCNVTKKEILQGKTQITKSLNKENVYAGTAWMCIKHFFLRKLKKNSENVVTHFETFTDKLKNNKERDIIQ